MVGRRFSFSEGDACVTRQVAPEATVVGMPDSGFFLDHEDDKRRFHTGLSFVFEAMRAGEGVDQVNGPN